MHEDFIIAIKGQNWQSGKGILRQFKKKDHAEVVLSELKGLMGRFEKSDATAVREKRRH